MSCQPDFHGSESIIRSVILGSFSSEGYGTSDNGLTCPTNRILAKGYIQPAFLCDFQLFGNHSHVRKLQCLASVSIDGISTVNIGIGRLLGSYYGSPHSRYRPNGVCDRSPYAPFCVRRSIQRIISAETQAEYIHLISTPFGTGSICWKGDA